MFCFSCVWQFNFSFQSPIQVYMSITCNYNQIMSKVTLGYWKSRGRAQIPRLLLAYTGVAFEDVQYKDPQQWFGKDKQSLGLQFPNLPYLIDGDLKLTETRAICQYIIERSKKNQQLLGKNLKERARILMVVEVINDVMEKINEIIYNPEMKTKRQTIFKDYISPRLKQLATFRGNKQFLFDRVTLPDFVLSELSYYVQNVFPNEFKNLQFLTDVRTKIMTIPEIKSYYEREESVKGPFTNLDKATIKF